MSSQHSFAVLESGSGNPSARDNFSGLTTIQESVNKSGDAGYIWPLFLSGLLAALIAALLFCQLSQVHTLSWTTLFFRAIEYVALTAAAGTAGIRILWSLLSEKPSFDLVSLSLDLGISWAFLPCIILFYRQHSVWMLVVIPVATAITTVCLRRNFADQVEAVQIALRHSQPSNMPVFAGMPADRSRPWHALCVSVSVQASVLLLLTGNIAKACLLLSMSSFLMARQWTAITIEDEEKRKNKRPAKLWLMSVLAVLATSLALLPWLNDGFMAARLHGLFGGGELLHKSPNQFLKYSGEQDKSSYAGIVLWPPPKKKTEIVPPPLHMHSLGAWNTSKPLVIPFDGPYWYFKAPDKKPSLKAHIVHGQPALVDIHSSDWHPLLMEAHQKLSSPIDLNCCLELQVAVTNADNRPGRIAIGVALTDATSPSRPSQYLGERSILSSEASHFSINRSPIEEVLRFSISSTSKIRRFDEITVFFLPAKERALGGAKVSIQQFKLIPH